ncbi:PREDICTED: uncharacterized protein LOC109389336 [Hipposideros armiger]|uniref:Uncharacterized protein LOC109389336 n=1 Tax=Hipposideros armiger TaxID=186990 RepID=A0A8B7SBX1_HIPAR|nr:PREDICTED: uncharacterized protein LOC109389336 [Hipposideros armiger]
MEGPPHNTDKAGLGTRKPQGSNLASCITVGQGDQLPLVRAESARSLETGHKQSQITPYPVLLSPESYRWPSEATPENGKPIPVSTSPVPTAGVSGAADLCRLPLWSCPGNSRQVSSRNKEQKREGWSEGSEGAAVLPCCTREPAAARSGAQGPPALSAPPPRRDSAVVPHLARALRWALQLVTQRWARASGHLRPGPRAALAGGAPSAPSHRAWRVRDSAGAGRARRPRRPGASRREARPCHPPQRRSASRPPQHVSVCLALCPAASSAGPKTAEFVIGPKGSCVSSGSQNRSSCHYVLEVIVGPRGAAAFQFLLALSSFPMLAFRTRSDPRPPLDTLLTTQRWQP